MNEQNDILERARQAGQPFKAPEGYFESFEDRLMARISAEAQPAASTSRRLWTVLKPALALAATFAIIFGMGYGVLSLTHTLDRGNADVSGYATVEEELIRPVSIINYYQSEGESEEEGDIDEDSIVSFLASELSYGDLTEIYAQSF